MKGTSYLRLKRYELYPFQENKAGKGRTPQGSAFKAAIINHARTWRFSHGQPFTPANYDLDRAHRVIAGTLQNNAAAEEGLNEQSNPSRIAF